MNVNRCCCQSTVCQPDLPGCLMVSISGVEMQAVCQYASNGGTVSQLNAIGINRTFSVPEVSPGVYSAIFPAFLYHRVTTGSGVYEQYSADLQVYIEASCNAGVMEINQLYLSFTNYIDDGTLPSGYLYSDSVIALESGTIGYLDQPIPSQYDGPGCSLNGLETHDFFGGGQAIVTAPGTCPPTNDYAIAEHCGGTLDPIVIDLADLPSSIVRNVEYNEELYYISEYTSEGTPVTVTFVTDSCDDTQWAVCYRCDGQTGSITVDLDALPAGTQTVRYNSVVYFITSKLSPQAPVTVEALADPCPGAQSRIGRRCDGNPGEVSFDPDTQPAGALTFVYDGVRYYPTNITSTLPPQLVLWSTQGCHTSGPGPTNICADQACNAGSANYPDCCAQAIYAGCPQCANVLTLRQRSKLIRTMSGQPTGVVRKTNKGLRKKGLISEAELEAMGFDPEVEARAAREGGCCGRPSD